MLFLLIFPERQLVRWIKPGKKVSELGVNIHDANYSYSHYMQILGLLRNKVNVSNLGNYEKIERILFDYSLGVQAKLSTLDTAIWVVMRVYRREFEN